MQRLFLSVMALGIVVVTPARANIIPNPDFAETRDGTLVAWKVDDVLAIPAQGAVTSKRNITVSLQQTSGQGHFLHLTTAGLASGDIGMVSAGHIRLLPGFTYELSLRYRASGLLLESGDRTKLAALIVDLLSGKTGFRIITSDNTPAWTTLKTTLTVPDGATRAGIHLSVKNLYLNNPVTIDLSHVVLEAIDPTLPNPGLENAAQGQPLGWQAVGGARVNWTSDMAHSGKACVSVSDAPDGDLSGWSTEIPVRPDRLYCFDGWVKGGDLNAHGTLGGGALEIQFLDNEGQPLGPPVISPAVSAATDWTHVATANVRAPEGAVSAQLVAGLRYTNGTAWFDDFNLNLDPVATEEEVLLQRDPQPDASVHYATNLLANGDIEAGTNGKPTGWTYHGKSAPDWTPAEIDQFHTEGRPHFEVGRAEGVWSHDLAYSGKASLLNISVDPPLSTNRQWYGRNPVDGYWLSAPMACKPGTAYLATGWIRPGKPLTSLWYGPLHLLFYDQAGHELATPTRSGMAGLPPGVWSFWGTLPYIAPPRATSMRLRFGQELSAETGGWGRTYADNLAVWQVPPDAPPPDMKATLGNTDAYEDWFALANATLKAPYLPSPSEAPAYLNVGGSILNSVRGNLYFDPQAPVPVQIAVVNQLGEQRKLAFTITRYDWLGNADPPITIADVAIPGYGQVTHAITLPPTGSYGTFYLDIEAREGKAVVGHLAGRYAELPKLDRPRTAENVWGVTPLTTITGDDTAYNHELGTMIKTAGFGTAWVRMGYTASRSETLDGTIAQTSRVIDWYHALGLQCMVQLLPQVEKELPSDAFGKTAGILAKGLEGKVRAFGNWGIEMANSASPYRGGGANRYTDEVYDSIVGAQYDGIKAATPGVPVFTGNVATDMEAKTLHRLYGAPCNGRFDGLIINTYLGISNVVQSAVKELDAHGDTTKNVWMEEGAYQRSPFEGEARRYGEAEGPVNMVRLWLGTFCANYPRLKIVTMWGFNTQADADINMVTTRLQPRPQFAAFAVMTNALADAVFVADHSNADVSAFAWKRGDGPLLVLWANAGDRTVTLHVSGDRVTVMDLMGNTQSLIAEKNLVALRLTTKPIYIFGGGALDISF